MPLPDSHRRRSSRLKTQPAQRHDSIDSDAGESNSTGRTSLLSEASARDESTSEDEDTAKHDLWDEGSRDVARTSAKRKSKKSPRKTNLKRSRVSISAENVPDDPDSMFVSYIQGSQSAEHIINQWLNSWSRDNTNAMTDMINFVIRCSGCRLRLSTEAIKDPDHAVDHLSSLQAAFEKQRPTDYPLNARTKSATAFRSKLIKFVEALAQSCHASEKLYSEQNLFDNLLLWLSAMSSSTLRSFRHTATICALTLNIQLCRIAAEIYANIAKVTRQNEAEARKKGVSKQRLKALEARQMELGDRTIAIEQYLKTNYDSVYVHRYRDVEPKIRLECVIALGTCITTLPDVYFDGIHLRYLGWVLSDFSAPVRSEVLRQLIKMYKDKDNVARLRLFTERFRVRLVEIAVQDAELSARVLAIDLLNHIRDMELLETDDMEAIGRLILDPEPRVRKAAASFFAKNVDELFAETMENLGSEEGLLQSKINGKEKDPNLPSLRWLKLKCLADILHSYDIKMMQKRAECQSRVLEGQIGNSSTIPSLLTNAAEACYSSIAETRNCNHILGLLLYDMPTSKTPFERKCELGISHQQILLEILLASISQALSHESSAGAATKRSRAQKGSEDDAQSSLVSSILKAIPELLSKYDTDVQSASIILRIPYQLDTSLLRKINPSTADLCSLVDATTKTFLSHSNRSLLQSAGAFIRRLTEFEDIEGAVDRKISLLWTRIVQDLKNVQASDQGGDLQLHSQRALSLASSTDCMKELAAPRSEGTLEVPDSGRYSWSGKLSSASAAGLMLNILRHAASGRGVGREVEKGLPSTMQTLFVYYMWCARALHGHKEAISSAQLPDYLPFSAVLLSLIRSRSRSSATRAAAIGCLLDLHTLFATFRNADSPLPSLVRPLGGTEVKLVVDSFVALESQFVQLSGISLDWAPKSGKSSQLNDDDDEVNRLPEDDEEEQEPRQDVGAEDDNDAESDVNSEILGLEKGEATALRKLTKVESSFYSLTGKIVRAIIARILRDESKVQARISQHRLQLGSTFKAIIGYLDPQKSGNAATAAGNDARDHEDQNPKTPKKSRKSIIAAFGDDQEGSQLDNDSNAIITDDEADHEDNDTNIDQDDEMEDAISLQ